MLHCLRRVCGRVRRPVESVAARREPRPGLRRTAVADVRACREHLRRSTQARLVTVFAEDRARRRRRVLSSTTSSSSRASPCYLILRAPMPADEPRFPSLAAELPAVNWQEREIQDLFGLEAVGHPNPRRVALHDNWPDVHPLRKDFPLRHGAAALRGRAPRLPARRWAKACSRCRWAGPRRHHRAGPLHFRGGGRADLYLQLRMFYTHKGTEKLFEDLPDPQRVFLAESISGDSSFSHGTAFCQAIETRRRHRSPAARAVMRTICWNWSASTITSPTSARSPPTSASSSPTRMPAG